MSLPRLDLDGDLDLLLLEDEEALRDRRRPRFFGSGEADRLLSFLSPSLRFFSSALALASDDDFIASFLSSLRLLRLSFLSSLRLFRRSFLSLSPRFDLLGGDLDLLLLLEEDEEEELLERRRRPFFFLSGEADRDLSLLSFTFPSSFLLSAGFSPLLLSSPRLPRRSFLSSPSLISLSFSFSFLSLSATFFSSFPFSSLSSLFRLFLPSLFSVVELLLRLAPFWSLRSLDRLRLRELKEDEDRLLEPLLLLLLLLLRDRRLRPRPRRRPRLETEESEEEEE